MAGWHPLREVIIQKAKRALLPILPAAAMTTIIAGIASGASLRAVVVGALAEAAVGLRDAVELPTFAQTHRTGQRQPMVAQSADAVVVRRASGAALRAVVGR